MTNAETGKETDNKPIARVKTPIYRSKRMVIFGCGIVGAGLAVKLSEAGNLIKSSMITQRLLKSYQ